MKKPRREMTSQTRRETNTPKRQIVIAGNQQLFVNGKLVGTGVKVNGR